MVTFPVYKLIVMMSLYYAWEYFRTDLGNPAVGYVRPAIERKMFDLTGFSLNLCLCGLRVF
jgi:hypothetical protein